MASLYASLAHRLHGPERECAADRHALDLCVRGGYAAEVGDEDMIHGPDAESEDELASDVSWGTRARIWLWQRSRGYLPIRDRPAALVRYLEEARSGRA